MAYLGEKGIGMKRSRVSEVLQAEGLKWRQEETWFGARVDPGSSTTGGDRAPLHRPARRRRSRLPRRDGAAVRPELSRPARGQAGPSQGAAGQAGNRLWPARRGRPRVRRLPASQGDALTAPYVGRTTANWVDFLGKVEAWIDPSVARVYAVMDNLNTHSATDVLLFALAHPRWEFVFQPKYAAYLNLIEPWWKILRSLALKGRRFETWAQIEEAVRRATAYWNEHKHPFLWGRRRRHPAARRPGVAVVPNIAIT